MNERIQKLYAYMEQLSLDAILITLPKHIYYLTGFNSEPHERFLGLILPKNDEPFLLVPVLDLQAAKESSQVNQIFTHTDTDNPYQVLKGLIRNEVKRIGVEKNHLTINRYEALMEIIAAEQFVDVEAPLSSMRAVKSPEEIIKIKQAVQIVEEVLTEGLTKVKPGVTEIELVAELEYLMKKAGVSPAFHTTILAGEKSAMPHGNPGDRTVERGELLLFDLGVCTSDGYLSDITRTYAIGDIDDKLKEIYNVVLEANLRAIAAVRPGAVLADLDRAAREYITEQGYGPYFMHRLGHGLGIEVHEYPSIHSENRDELREGMVITIEPGIYLPGVGGVRIEDDVLVTADGAEVLSSLPKELTVVG